MLLNFYFYSSKALLNASRKVKTKYKDPTRVSSYKKSIRPQMFLSEYLLKALGSVPRTRSRGRREEK